MKILIADDHPIVREGLREVLKEEFPQATFGEAGTAREALERFWSRKWDVAIVDINLPGRSGLELVGEFKRARAATGVLVLTIHPEDQYAIRAFKAGADGYLTKNCIADELIAAVQKIRRGQKYVSASLAEKLAAALQSKTELPAHELLSEREFQVLRLLTAGQTVKEIAAEMALSVQTISTYRTRMLKKMRLKTNAQLIRYAVDHGLAD